MSEAGERPRQEEDTLPTGRVSMVLVALVVLSLGCIVYASLLLGSSKRAIRAEDAGRIPARAPAEAGPIPPDRHLLSAPRRFVDEWLPPQRERLEGWGWVDRERGIVHIPIDKAMEIVAREEGR